MDNRLRSGFSLLELLCVLAIMGILATLSIPAYQDHLHRGYREQTKALLLNAVSALSKLTLQTPTGVLPAEIESTRDLWSPDSELYDFSLTRMEDGAFQYWLAAIPKSEGRQMGNGALTLTNTGLGCWHQNQDEITNIDCDGVNDHPW